MKNTNLKPRTQNSSYISPLTHPIPARLCTRILAGEYLDFNSLLAYAMFSTHDPQPHTQTFTTPQSGEVQFASTPTQTKKINSFALWMENWNVYATILSAKPSQAFECFGYQHIITSLNLSLPLNAWMTYDKVSHSCTQPPLPTLGMGYTPPGHIDRLHTYA